ncbi:MAG: hypothetical protein O3C57_07295, partial [Verrucomicrobia bacterium]|nr:hypothetical protein [Verrucomicrobiota bacterium]
RPFEKIFKVVDEFAPQIDAFSKGIQNNSRIEPDGVQGLRDMNILQAIYSAARVQKLAAVNY